MAVTQFSRRVLARFIAGKLIAEPTRHEYWITVLAAYLTEHKRAATAGLIIKDIEHELLVQAGQLHVSVTSARPLTEQLRRSLSAALSAQTGAKEVHVSEETDPALLGGLIARTADAELDASVRTKLHQLATIE